MKKHLTSLQSTRHAQEQSIFSYNTSIYKPIVNYKLQVDKLFKTLHQILKLRSYLVFRDLQQIHSDSITTPQQLMSFAFPNKSTTDKLYEKNQIEFFVKIIFQLNKQKHQSAKDGRMKDFQMYKQLIDYFQQKTLKYEQSMRQSKENQQIQSKMKQHYEKQQDFNRIQSSVRQNMVKRQRRIMSSFIENKIKQDRSQQHETQRTFKQQQYKLNASRLLSQAKDLSLRVKLSPYASQLKRQHDYNTLNSRLSRTIDLDVERKVAMMDKMKRVEREKRNRQHQKRYSVLEDRFAEEQHLEQRSLNHLRQKLQKSFDNQLQHVSNSNRNKKNTLLGSLKKSLNAYNMHSDSIQIRRIIQHHKNNGQFENEVTKCGSLMNVNQCQPLPYATISYKINHSLANQDSKHYTMRQQRRILRRFSKVNNNRQVNQQFNIVNDAINNKTGRIKREKSLVALYDNQLEENLQQ